MTSEERELAELSTDYIYIARADCNGLMEDFVEAVIDGDILRVSTSGPISGVLRVLRAVLELW